MKKSTHFAAILLSAWACSSSAVAQSLSNPIPADLLDWICTGQCGTLGADGDITASPLGNAQYAYVTTSGSQAFDVSPIELTESGGNSTLFTDTNGSAYTSPTFTLQAGQSVGAWFNYASTDGKGFDDYAWGRLVNVANPTDVTYMFTARSTNSNKQSIVPGDLEVGFDAASAIVNYDDFDFQVRNTAIGDPIDWSALGLDNGLCWREDAQGCGFTGWLSSSVTVANTGSYRFEAGVVNFGDTLYESGLAFDLVGLQPSPVPEPSTWSLLLAGLGIMAWMRQRKAI
jgi:PEP-CTERM motif